LCTIWRIAPDPRFAFDETLAKDPLALSAEGCSPTSGVPTDCTAARVCDIFETGFGVTGRDIFRGPFQKRLDIPLIKTTKIGEHMVARLGVDAFNVTNTPSFDVPTNSASQYSVSSGVPTIRALPASFGLIQHTIGSPRFMQLSPTLAF
jgi:hypothetical protein